MPRWWLLFGSVFLIFNTLKPRSLTSSGVNSVNWLGPRLAKSKQVNSFRTAASASLKMVVSVARSWVSALAISNLSMPSSFVSPEPAILIGLNILTTNGVNLMAPELNRRRAAIVLSKIDELLAWEKSSEQERDVRFVDLGRYLCEVRAGQYWRVDNLGSFDEFLEQEVPGARSKAYYFMAIHEHLPRVSKPDLKSVGWAKAIELVK